MAECMVANGTIELTGKISATEDIQIVAHGDDVGLIGVTKSGVFLSGDVDTVSGNINITALEAVANGTGTTPSLNFTGNVTLTGPMEFEGITATFDNGVEASGNDLTLNFTQTATLDGFQKL